MRKTNGIFFNEITPKILLVTSKAEGAFLAVKQYLHKQNWDEKKLVIVNNWRGEHHLLKVEMIKNWLDELRSQYLTENRGVVEHKKDSNSREIEEPSKIIAPPKTIYLLIDIDQARAEVQNALLKTLEEPPSGVAILMTATSASAILPTIVSRTEIVDLRNFNARKEEKSQAKGEGERKGGKGKKNNARKEEKSETKDNFPDLAQILTEALNENPEQRIKKAGQIIALIESELKNKVEADLEDEPLAEEETKNVRETRAAEAVMSEITDFFYQKLRGQELRGQKLENQELRGQELENQNDKNQPHDEKNILIALEQFGSAYQLLQTNVSPKLILEDCFLQILLKTA